MQDGPPKPKARFRWRALTTFVLTLSFLTALATGAVLYFTPKGRVAHWTGWRVLGLGKEEWSAVHITTSVLLIVAALFHLVFNWKVFVHYFRSRTGRGFRLKREFVAALAVAALFVGGTIADVPPFATLIRWNDQIKGYWERTSAEPPYPHAEESTLDDFARNVDIPLETVIQRLATHGYAVTDPSMKVGEVARRYGVGPSVLYRQMQGTAEGSMRRGFGRGQKTLGEVCEERNIPLEQARAALKARGVEAGPDHRLRSLAQKLGGTPQSVLELIAAPRAQP